MTAESGKNATVITWMGANIEELSREELIGIVKHLGRALETERDSHRGTLRMWEAFSKARA